MWVAWDAGWTSVVGETLNTLLILGILFYGTKAYMAGPGWRLWTHGLFLVCILPPTGETWSWAVIFATIAFLGRILTPPVVARVLLAHCEECHRDFPTLKDFEQHVPSCHG